MKSLAAAKIESDDISEDYAEALEAEADGRCAISDGRKRSTVTVFWYAAPASSAPGGPALQVVVRA